MNALGVKRLAHTRKLAAHVAAIVEEAGLNAAWALAAAAVMMPLLRSWVGADERQQLHLDPLIVAMAGLFSFALLAMVVGRILEAAVIKAENDQII